MRWKFVADLVSAIRNAASETFCGTCGCNLAEVELNLLKACEDKVQRAIASVASSTTTRRSARYAKSSYRKTRRFEPIIQRALVLMNQWGREIWRGRRPRRHTWTARERLDAYDFAAAIKRLEKIPTEFRDEQAKKLLEEAEFRLHEIARN